MAVLEVGVTGSSPDFFSFFLLFFQIIKVGQNMRWSEKRKMLDFVPKCVGKALKGQKWVFSGEGGGSRNAETK